MIEMSKLVDQLKNKNIIDHGKDLDPSVDLPKYFQPLTEAINSAGLEHNYGYSISCIINNIMNIKIEQLRQELKREIQSETDPRKFDWSGR